MIKTHTTLHVFSEYRELSLSLIRLVLFNFVFMFFYLNAIGMMHITAAISCTHLHSTANISYSYLQEEEIDGVDFIIIASDGLWNVLSNKVSSF